MVQGWISWYSQFNACEWKGSLEYVSWHWLNYKRKDYQPRFETLWCCVSCQIVNWVDTLETAIELYYEKPFGNIHFSVAIEHYPGQRRCVLYLVKKQAFEELLVYQSRHVLKVKEYNGAMQSLQLWYLLYRFWMTISNVFSYNCSLEDYYVLK